MLPSYLEFFSVSTELVFFFLSKAEINSSLPGFDYWHEGDLFHVWENDSGFRLSWALITVFSLR